jgi:excisionase family DNA binding protein
VIGGQLLTLRDVAAELGCSVTTIKRRVREGALPVYVDGHLVRVREDDLRRYVAERVRRRARSSAPAVAAGRRLPKGARLWD